MNLVPVGQFPLFPIQWFIKKNVTLNGLRSVIFFFLGWGFWAFNFSNRRVFVPQKKGE